MEVLSGASSFFACCKRSISASIKLRISFNAIDQSIDPDAAVRFLFPTNDQTGGSS